MQREIGVGKSWALSRCSCASVESRVVRNADAEEASLIRRIVPGYKHYICSVAQQSSCRESGAERQAAQSICIEQRILTHTRSDGIAPTRPVHTVGRHHDDAGGIVRQNNPTRRVQRRAGSEIAMVCRHVGNVEPDVADGDELAYVLTAIWINTEKELNLAGK